MGIKSLFSVNYLNWDEYTTRIRIISWLNALNKTMESSINNWWKNYKKDISN